MEHFSRRADYYICNEKPVIELKDIKDKLKYYVEDIDKKLTEHELNFLIHFISTETQKELSEEKNIYRKYEKEKDKILKVQELTNKYIDENYTGEEHDKAKADAEEVVTLSLIRLNEKCKEETGKTLIEREGEEEIL